MAIVVVGSCVTASALYFARGGSLPGVLGRFNPSATATPVLPSVLADPLAVNNNGWSDDGQTCFFGPDGYHVSGASCFAPEPAIGVETVSVQASIVKGGSDFYYGAQFWQQPTLSLNCYAFLLNGGGHWSLFRTVNDKDTELASSSSSAIHTGAGATNTLEARAVGPHRAVHQWRGGWPGERWDLSARDDRALRRPEW
jgi:hypothetical protein